MAARKQPQEGAPARKSWKLAYTVDVREAGPVDPNHPRFGEEFGRRQTFQAGEELTGDNEWARDYVGDHVYAPDDDE